MAITSDEQTLAQQTINDLAGPDGAIAIEATLDGTTRVVVLATTQGTYFQPVALVITHELFERLTPPKGALSISAEDLAALSKISDGFNDTSGDAA